MEPKKISNKNITGNSKENTSILNLPPKPKKKKERMKKTSPTRFLKTVTSPDSSLDELA
jgi:hypothetical protein